MIPPILRFSVVCPRSEASSPAAVGLIAPLLLIPFLLGGDILIIFTEQQGEILRRSRFSRTATPCAPLPRRRRSLCPCPPPLRRLRYPGHLRAFFMGASSATPASSISSFHGSAFRRPSVYTVINCCLRSVAPSHAGLTEYSAISHGTALFSACVDMPTPTIMCNSRWFLQCSAVGGISHFFISLILMSGRRLPPCV